MKAEFSGYEEYLERGRYLALEPSEQGRALKERLEKDITHSTISRAEVRNAQNPDENVKWEATGEREFELTDRISIEPFPGMPSPLPLPSSWPEGRTEMILLDHLFLHAARCRLPIPEGYGVVPQAAFGKANGFGKVFWEWGMARAPGTPQLEVRLRVETSKLVASPEAYADLKQFIEWVREAMSRQLMLERSRK